MSHTCEFHCPASERSIPIICRYEPIAHEDFMQNIMSKLYSASDLPVWDSLHSHQLAVFFLIMAIGIAWKSDLAEDRIEAEKFYSLGLASLSLDPVTRVATSWTIQTLFLMNQYYAFMDRPGSERRWLMTGLMTRLAVSVSDTIHQLIRR